MKFLNHLQFEENEARKMKLYRVGATGYTPSVSAAGNVIFDTGDSIPKWWDGSNWRDFSHGTSGGVLYDLLVAQNSGSNNNPILRLDPSSGSNDDITITGGSNITVTRNSASQITIAGTANTNQLTTFSLAGDSGSSQTIAHGNTLTIAGGGGINTEAGTATDQITVSHADTSSLSSTSNSGRTYIQNITVDTYGHVTELETATETVTNTNTQNAYAVSIPSSTTKLRLSGSGAAGNTTDDIEFVGSGATTVARTNDSKFTISSTNTEYSMMTSSVLGLGKLFSDTTQSVAANNVSGTASRTYGVQKNSSNQLVVNVPWTDTTIANTNTTFTLPTTNGANPDLVLTGSDSSTDVVNLNGTANEVEVTGSGTNTITFGLPDDVIIAGNLTVQGTTTSIDSNTVNIGDSIITLNSDETGTPSQNGGIEIERGTATNQSLVWNESTDKWSTYNGSTYVPIIQDLYKNFQTQNGTATANTTTDTLTLTGANGIATSRSGDTITFTAATNVTAATIAANDFGSGETTSTITHNFGTKDVIVELWQVSDASNSKVEANVTCTTNTVVVSFSSTPTVDVRIVIMAAKVLADNSVAYSE